MEVFTNNLIVTCFETLGICTSFRVIRYHKKKIQHLHFT